MTSTSREEGRRVLAEVRARAKKEAAAREGSNIIALKHPVAGQDGLDVAEGRELGLTRWSRFTARRQAGLSRPAILQPSVVDVVDAQSTEIDGTLLKWIVAKNYLPATRQKWFCSVMSHAGID